MQVCIFSVFFFYLFGVLAFSFFLVIRFTQYDQLIKNHIRKIKVALTFSLESADTWEIDPRKNEN